MWPKPRKTSIFLFHVIYFHSIKYTLNSAGFCKGAIVQESCRGARKPLVLCIDSTGCRAQAAVLFPRSFTHDFLKRFWCRFTGRLKTRWEKLVAILGSCLVGQSPLAFTVRAAELHTGGETVLTTPLSGLEPSWAGETYCIGKDGELHSRTCQANIFNTF